MTFVTLYRPYRKDQPAPHEAELQAIDGGYCLTAKLGAGSLRALLPTRGKLLLKHDGLQARDWATVELRSLEDKPVQTLRLPEHSVKGG